MITEMTIEYEAHRTMPNPFRSQNEGGIPGFSCGGQYGLHIIEVPEPYQAGDDPSIHFWHEYAEGAELMQYGQQPRSL